MRKFLQHVLSLTILFVVSGFGLISHASAMPVSMHQMSQDGSHAHHSQSSSTSRCVTLCTSAIVQREDELKDSMIHDDNNEPDLPFYLVGQHAVYDSESTKVALATASVKPPPKVPIYIRYGVFRV